MAKGGINRTINIPQPSIFGRIGTGIGQGLSEQIPKEIERNRLKSGLKELSEKEGLTPFQQISGLLSIPGMTPQGVQSLEHILRYQNLSNAYKNRAGGGNAQQGKEQQGSQANPNTPQSRTFGTGMGQNLAEPNASRSTMRNEEAPAYGGKQLGENAADERGLARFQNSPQERAALINELVQDGFLPDQAEKMADDIEARRIAEGRTYDERRQQKRARIQEADDELTKSLETRLQKTGEGVYKDITGDMVQDLKSKMNRELVLHPEASTREIADNFSKRALALAQAKSEVSGIAQKTGIESIFQGDKNLIKLRAFQKIFADAGNEKEYSRMLRDEMGLSPQGADVIAFPASDNIKKYVSNYKPQHYKSSTYVPDPERIDANSRKAALEVADMISDKDSLLAIARILSEKDPYFNQRAFFEQLDENTNSRFNDRHKEEIGLGERDILPTWGDIKIFPTLRRSTK